MTTLPSDPNELRAKSMHLTIVGERFDLTATDIVYTFGVFAGPVKWTLRLTYDDFVRHHDVITQAYGKQTATASSVGKGNTVSFTAPVVCELPKLTGKVYIRPRSDATGYKRLPKLEYYLQQSVTRWTGWSPVEAVELPSPVPPHVRLLLNKHVAAFLKVREHVSASVPALQDKTLVPSALEPSTKGDVALTQAASAKTTAPVHSHTDDEWVVVDDGKQQEKSNAALPEPSTAESEASETESRPTVEASENASQPTAEAAVGATLTSTELREPAASADGADIDTSAFACPLDAPHELEAQEVDSSSAQSEVASNSDITGEAEEFPETEPPAEAAPEIHVPAVEESVPADPSAPDCAKHAHHQAPLVACVAWAGAAAPMNFVENSVNAPPSDATHDAVRGLCTPVEAV